MSLMASLLDRCVNAISDTNFFPSFLLTLSGGVAFYFRSLSLTRNKSLAPDVSHVWALSASRGPLTLPTIFVRRYQIYLDFPSRAIVTTANSAFYS